MVVSVTAQACIPINVTASKASIRHFMVASEGSIQRGKTQMLIVRLWLAFSEGLLTGHFTKTARSIHPSPPSLPPRPADYFKVADRNLL
jgi:hypothetical protein